MLSFVEVGGREVVVKRVPVSNPNVEMLVDRIVSSHRRTFQYAVSLMSNVAWFARTSPAANQGDRSTGSRKSKPGAVSSVQHRTWDRFDGLEHPCGGDHERKIK